MPSGEDLPSIVLHALENRSPHPPLESVPTERFAPLPTLQATVNHERLWLVRTVDHIWLIAAGDPDVEGLGLAHDVAIAASDPQSVRIDRTFGRTSVVVNNVRAAIATKHLESAAQLIKRFSSSSSTPLPLDARFAQTPPQDIGPSSAIPNIGLSDTWNQIGGGHQDEVWLHALRCKTQITLLGHIRDIPKNVWLGISEQRLRLAIESPDKTRPELGIIDLDVPLQFSSHQGRPMLVHRGIRLVGGFFQYQAMLLAHRLSCVQGGLRWALLVNDKFQEGALNIGLEWLNIAISRGHNQFLAEPLAGLAAAVNKPAVAAGYLRSAIDSFGERADYRGFLSNIERLKALPQADIQECLERVPQNPIPPIEHAPWPPETPKEIWAAAAAHSRLTPELAVQPLQAAPQSVRALQWIAAITKTPIDERRAAIALQSHGQVSLAREALLRTLERAPNPEDAWLNVNWAVDDPTLENPETAIEYALVQDPQARTAASCLSATAFHTVASYADKNQLPIAPILMDLADRYHPQTEVEQRVAVARRILEIHQSPAAAARILSRVANQLENSTHHLTNIEDAPEMATPASAEPPLSSGQIRLASAQAFIDAGLDSAAVEAVHQAVTEDFLHASVLRTAASLTPLDVSKATRGWWSHMAEVLDPSDSSTPLSSWEPSPVSSLDPGRIDTLYPSKIDRIFDWRSRLLVPPLPDRDQLIRGLERIETSNHPQVFELVKGLCLSLSIAPVPAYIYRGDQAFGISVWPTRPPVILIGADHLYPGPRHLRPAELRFALAVELTHLAAGHPVLTINQNVGTSQSIYHAFGRFAGTAETALDVVSLIPGIDQLAKLQQLIKLSRRVFSIQKTVNRAHDQLAQPLIRRVFPGYNIPNKNPSQEGLKGAALLLRLQADRAALRLTGDLRAAVNAIIAVGPHAERQQLAFETKGLAPLIAPSADTQKSGLNANDAVRIASLFEDAAQNGPF